MAQILGLLSTPLRLAFLMTQSISMANPSRTVDSTRTSNSHGKGSRPQSWFTINGMYPHGSLTLTKYDDISQVGLNQFVTLLTHHVDAPASTNITSKVNSFRRSRQSL